MDKDINTFAMRLKEWFAWHFPELTKIVNDNGIYARLVNLCDARRDNLTEDTKDETKWPEGPSTRPVASCNDIKKKQNR